MTNLLERAKMFSIFADKPVVFVDDMLRTGENYWFVCSEFKECNPSNHIHFNELTGKCINPYMMSMQQFDSDMFNTKLEEIQKCQVLFSSNVKWIKIR